MSPIAAAGPISPVLLLTSLLKDWLLLIGFLTALGALLCQRCKNEGRGLEVSTRGDAEGAGNTVRSSDALGRVSLFTLGSELAADSKIGLLHALRASV